MGQGCATCIELFKHEITLCFQTGNCTTLTYIHKHEGMAKESRRITNNGSMYSTKLVGYPFHSRKVFAFIVRG